MENLKMCSKDFPEENIQKLIDLFPNCVTEIKSPRKAVKTNESKKYFADELKFDVKKGIDFDLLKQELSDYIVEGKQERYHLDWPGKRAALLTANTPITKTLRPCREESKNFDSTQNLFVEGDNLDALKLLQETYLGRVKMIYIDPPYNTGKDFIYSDKFSESKQDYLLGSKQKDVEGNRLIANTESNGRFHSDWLSMILPRLKLARNLLKDDGVIFISIDDAEAPNLKRVCDEVFGESNHYCTFVWKRRSGAMDSVNNVSSDHEYVICYGKQQDKLNGVKRTYDRYSNPDNDERGPWIADNLSAGKPGGNTYYAVIDPATGNQYWPPKGRYWPYSPETMAIKISEGRIIFPKTGEGSPLLKRFQLEAKSEVVPISTWGVDKKSKVSNAFITALNTEGTKEVKRLFGDKVFTFPKPTQLIKSLIMQGAGVNDIILDFFAGASVTADAVMQLNSEDNGTRKFIMFQLPEVCDEKSVAFKEGYKTIAEISKERIRRAGKKIKEENKESASNLDIGFRVLKIDSSNMKDIYYNPDDIEQYELEGFTENIKEDRTSEDLLFQVLLDWGVDLSLPIKIETIDKLEVFFVDKNALAACFAGDGDITEEFCKALAKKQPLRVVFRDSGFKDDSAKINVEQIFKLLSPHTDIRTI
jgi:adenine-specific DNA-methyltransferase